MVGRTITIDELMEEYGFEALFIGSGAGLPMFMNIPGENLKGVYSANEMCIRDSTSTVDIPLSSPEITSVSMRSPTITASAAWQCSSRRPVPVSYTHLDVYKRQAHEMHHRRRGAGYPAQRHAGTPGDEIRRRGPTVQTGILQ